jgi:maleylacetoacetate isomerase
VDLLKDEQLTDVHRVRNPSGYVPSLTLEGVTYFETVAIVEMLEERFPSPPLFPSDLTGRARVRALVEMINAGIQPLQNKHLLAYLSPEAEVKERWLKHFVSRGLAAIEAALGLFAQEGTDGPFAYGKSPTAADVFLVPQVFAAPRFKVDLVPYPRVVRAFEAAMALEPFQAASPDKQPDFKP